MSFSGYGSGGYGVGGYGEGAPAAPVAGIIANLESEVIFRLENQTTQTARADIWIRDAILEISGNTDYRDDFDDLEVLGPQVNLTGGTGYGLGNFSAGTYGGGSPGTSIQEYPFSTFLPQPVGTIYNLSTLDVMIWTDYPTNSKRRRLDPTHYQEADKFNTYPSLPTAWYRFADTLGFDPPPDKNYQVQLRCLQRHPFIDYYNTTQPVGLLSTSPILLPLEWYEVITWAAVMRGFMELLEFDKAGEIRSMLYGDPKHPEQIGLVAGIKKRRNREAWRTQQSLRPIVQGSTWGS